MGDGRAYSKMDETTANGELVLCLKLVVLVFVLFLIGLTNEIRMKKV